MADYPNKLITVLVGAMEDAEQISGASGPDKKRYALEAVRRLAASTLSLDESILVGDLTPALVDLIVAASRGLIDVNVVNEKGEPSPRCFSKSCTLM